jgi:Flp pilus assembly protein TadG
MRGIAGIFQFVRRLSEIAADKSGNVSITFAIAVIPLIGFVGAAVDYSHANSIKQSDALCVPRNVSAHV